MTTLFDQYGKPMNLGMMRKARKNAELRAAYDAAIDTEENRKHWRYADNLSATAANSIEVRRKLRSRARYEALEANSFAKGICLTLANDTISRGPGLQVNLKNKFWRNFIESEWAAWCKATKLHQKLRTAKLSKTIDGEIFFLKTTSRRLKTPVQLNVRLIESDQISTPGFIDGMDPKQVDGIEFDDDMEPMTYHLLKAHPGDRWPQLAWQKEDIDASDMIHMFRAERPGQARGISEIATALPLFAFLRRWTLAVILASELAADFAAVLETAAAAYDEDDIDDVSPFSNVPIDRGMLTAMPRGYKMSQFKPEQPTNTYEGFRNAILQEIARCVHMPANKARADSSSYNYSSGRLDHQTYYEAIAIEQSDWEVECLDRIFEWWLDEALMLPGYLDGLELAGEVPHQWRWPPHRDVDPAELADVNIAMINSKLKTRKQFWMEQNLDPDQMVADIQEEQELFPGDVEAMNAKVQELDESAAAFRKQSSDGTSQAEEDIPTGEFANVSRAQLKNNVKAIDDALAKYESGDWSKSRAKIFLRSIGLKDATITELLDECEVVK